MKSNILIIFLAIFLITISLDLSSSWRQKRRKKFSKHTVFKAVENWPGMKSKKKYSKPNNMKPKNKKTNKNPFNCPCGFYKKNYKVKFFNLKKYFFDDIIITEGDLIRQQEIS